MMMDRGRAAAKVALVDSQPGRTRRLQAHLGTDQRFAEIVAYPDLNAAFVAIESAPPSIVVIAADLTVQDEFPMFAALLDMLRLERVLVGNPGSTPPRSTICVSDEPSEVAAAIAKRLKLGPAVVGGTPKPSVPASERFEGTQKLVVIGSSTGGIEALESILGHYPADCPPTLIVQHIKADFVTGLVRRLNASCAARVDEAREGDLVKPGRVLVAPGQDAHLVLRPRGMRCTFQKGEPISGHRPSIDCLFHSAVPYAPAVVGTILTGMGRDGADGLRRIRNAGGWTIGQDRATSVVYGMPQAARSLGAVTEELPIHRIGPSILSAARKKVVSA